MAPQNPLDYFAIQNTLSRYCFALDNKDFNLLRHVFTSDVRAKYPFAAEEVKGLQTITDTLKKRLAPVSTQHALTTQTIEVAENGKSATATTYFTGTHFGKGKWQGKEVTAWGKYIDQLTLVEGKDSLPGASGQWLIERRECVFMGRLGEEGVMSGE